MIKMPTEFYARLHLEKELRNVLKSTEKGSKLYLKTQQRIARLQGGDDQLNQLERERRDAEKLKVFEDEEEIEWMDSKGKKKQSWADFSLGKLKLLLTILPRHSSLYDKFRQLISQAAKLKVPPSSIRGTTSTPKAPNNERVRRKTGKDHNARFCRVKQPKKKSIEKKKNRSIKTTSIGKREQKHQNYNNWKVKQQKHQNYMNWKVKQQKHQNYMNWKVKEEKNWEEKEWKYLNNWKEKYQNNLPNSYLLKWVSSGLKVPKLVKRCFFSDLTEEQLMPSFGEVRKFRFVLCKVFLSYNSVDAKARSVSKRHLSTEYTYDLPNDTAHGTVVGSGHQLFGSIRAAGFSLDPASPPYNIFHHKFNDSIVVPKLGCLSPHFCYCSVPFSTSIKIAADMNTMDEYYTCFRDAPAQFNDVFEICNDSAVINFND